MCLVTIFYKYLFSSQFLLLSDGHLAKLFLGGKQSKGHYHSWLYSHSQVTTSNNYFGKIVVFRDGGRYSDYGAAAILKQYSTIISLTRPLTHAVAQVISTIIYKNKIYHFINLKKQYWIWKLCRRYYFRISRFL